ncbi:MAG: LamB/YcsF family protein [Bacillota bacterium]|uniref:LamB/YcsF family protein n=1 Tax=Virgibacillus salarius TaxID=447199 RepID=UPI0024939CE5|nr:5-oxoprolinase subunit PxpA [Virgibacillus salarius]WBX78615.1 LamB/YcsF family protein [Virgibacillus salarius]
MLTIDVNCDMGESFGAYTVGVDKEIITFISSANIACGMHAGDPFVMNKTVRLAKQFDIAIGAHPSFPDLAGFGRRMMEFSSKEIYQIVIYQLGSLSAFCKIHEVKLNHVKPHGALYNLAARDRLIASTIAQAVYQFDPNLVLIGLANSELIKAGKEVGLRVASEVFADRTYQSDGSLTPRTETNAIIENVDEAIQQVKRIVLENNVEATDGSLIKIDADTVCIHGDGSYALTFAKALHQMLKNIGVSIAHL